MTTLSKKLRFRVFKRDGFVCQYCGRTPPNVTLECDHIIARASGGADDIDNLTTACIDCNRGKGAESLDSLPETLAEKHAVLEEQEDQIKEYKKLLARKRRRQNAEVKVIEQIFDDIGQLTEDDKQSIRAQFLPRLMPEDIESAMRLAVSRKWFNPNTAWKYFCGICWRKIREKEGVDE